MALIYAGGQWRNVPDRNNAQGSSPAAVAAAIAQPARPVQNNAQGSSPAAVAAMIQNYVPPAPTQPPVDDKKPDDTKPGGNPQPTYDDTDLRNRINNLQNQLNNERQAQRNNIFDTVAATLKSYGIDADGNGLAALVRQWAQEDKSAAWIQVNLRDTEQYKQRFPAMQTLIQRKMAIDEATYIAQERAYNAVLKAADLPTGFYDGPEDYASLITGQVSAKELQDRVDSAKTFLDANTDPSYKAKLTQYFGISDGQMLAYVLDGERAQSIINKQIKTAAMGGAAARAGFDLDSSQAGRYAGSLGQEYDAFGTDDRTRLDTALSALGVEADTQQRLAQIDQDNAFARTDVLDAGLLGDAEKKLASQTRRNREVGRFTGTSAIGRGSLSRNTGV